MKSVPITKSVRITWKSILFVLLGALGASSVHSAQCPAPDQLDGGPCCSLAPDAIPEFPFITQDSLSICWRDCGIESMVASKAKWKNLDLTPSDCGYRMSRFQLFNGAGVLEWSGIVNLLYSRTWMETNPAGVPLQVWRFLVNGNLSPTTAVGPAPCPLPPCAIAFGNLVKFTGYVDYAQSCGTGAFETAWMLTHVCDTVDHHAGFPRAGVFHPNRSYTFVGPAAGFVAAPVVPTEGTAGSPFEVVRRLRQPAAGTPGRILCEFEERFNHSLTPNQQFCLCGPLAANPQWMLGNLSGLGVCGTSIATPGGPLLPGFLSMGIGSWTIPGAYPGVERLRWNVGNYNYTDPCPGVVKNEVFYGVTTLGGYPATQVNTVGPVAVLPLTFIDQANALKKGTVATIMNVPFVSEHVLNLNH